MTQMDDIDHGTYAGYMQCRKAPDGPCRACWAAAAAYQREWRWKNPDRQAEARERNALLGRAKTILAGRHRAELYRIIAELEAIAAAQKERNE